MAGSDRPYSERFDVESLAYMTDFKNVPPHDAMLRGIELGRVYQRLLEPDAFSMPISPKNGKQVARMVDAMGRNGRVRLGVGVGVCDCIVIVQEAPGYGQRDDSDNLAVKKILLAHGAHCDTDADAP